MKVGIIGAGIVGSTVAIKLQEKGYCITSVASRCKDDADRLARRVGAIGCSSAGLIEDCELILIATPDRVIAPLVREFQNIFRQGQTLVHFSGSMSSDVMSPARFNGAKLLSVHPLQSFANIEVALETIAGAHFAIEGDDPELGHKLVIDLGGIPHLYRPEGKKLYHAGACVASNYLVVLADLAVKLLQSAGFEKDEALQSLIPLMKGTLANLESVGIPDALTGPIARGDYPVVEGHMNLLTPAISEIYSQLGLWAVDIAEEKGTLDRMNKEKLTKTLTDCRPGMRKSATTRMQQTS